MSETSTLLSKHDQQKHTLPLTENVSMTHITKQRMCWADYFVGSGTNRRGTNQNELFCVRRVDMQIIHLRKVIACCYAPLYIVM